MSTRSQIRMCEVPTPFDGVAGVIGISECERPSMYPCRDSERFMSTCNDLQEHGRHPKSLQDSLRHRYCAPRCVPRFSGNLAKLIDWLRGLAHAPKTVVLPFRYKLPVTCHPMVRRDAYTAQSN